MPPIESERQMNGSDVRDAKRNMSKLLKVKNGNTCDSTAASETNLLNEYYTIERKPTV